MSGPGRNDPCPCGSGRKYKQCCGRQAPARRPDDATLVRLMQTALGLHRAGRLAEAESAYLQALRHSPDVPEAHLNLGIISVARRRFERAIACYRRALALRPGYAEAWFGLGQACHGAGRQEEAASHLKKTLGFRPHYAPAHNTLGLVLDEMGRTEEAIDCYRQALEADPRLFVARCNLGRVLLNRGEVDEAAGHLERALATEPRHSFAHLGLGEVRLRQGDPAGAVEHFRQAIEAKPDQGEAHDSHAFSLCYVSDDPRAILAPHLAWAERFETPLRASWPRHANSPDPERRLRVGYVSADFRHHAVATFMEPILAHHDRERVEVCCYYNSTTRDEVTERLEALADRWLACFELTDAQLAARIAADGIDVLVDLSGHTTGHRLEVFARRPAPVQVTWLGYPATTGLTAIDYRLVTADTDPPGAEAWHSERLWRLPRTLWCYRPSPAVPAVDPEVPAIRHGQVRFVCANNIAKVSDASIAVWSRILAALPGSTLTVTSVPEGVAQRRLQGRMKAAGIDAARLRILGKLPAPDFYAMLGGSDIALDPWPYNGTTTSCDLLWMGLPVVALAGRTSAGRSGHALLSTLALGELVARDEDDYARIAVGLAQDLRRLGVLRSSMRDRMASSALRDAPGMARDIEEAFRGMWREWCGGGP